MKAWVEWDEWYPVYEIKREKTWSGMLEVDLPAEIVEKIEQAMLEFRSAQNLLCEARELASPRPR